MTEEQPHNPNNMLDELRQHLDSLTPEQFAEEFESITHDRLYERWVEKAHALTTEKRAEWIDAIIKKYSSDEYREKEYSLGYEPREDLYTLIQKYAEKYGEKYDVENNSQFLASSLIFDDTWVVKLYIGQGSFITVYRKAPDNTLTEEDEINAMIRQEFPKNLLTKEQFELMKTMDKLKAIQYIVSCNPDKFRLKCACWYRDAYLNEDY